MNEVGPSSEFHRAGPGGTRNGRVENITAQVPQVQRMSLHYRRSAVELHKLKKDQKRIVTFGTNIHYINSYTMYKNNL